MKGLLCVVGMVIASFCGFELNAQSNSQPRVYAYDVNSAYREHNVDFINLTLNIAFQPQAGKVIGSASYTYTVIRSQIDSIQLDAPGITISAVKVDGLPVKFTTSPLYLSIFTSKGQKFGEKHTLLIDYNCNPTKGIYFIGWNDSTKRRRQQIWTQGQGIDNRYWIPSFDDPSDKLTTEMIVTFPKAFSVLSNGGLVSKTSPKSGNKDDLVWHYKMSKPHALYLIMVGIGKYDIVTKTTKGGVLLQNWCYSDAMERCEPTYRHTEAIMDFFEAEIGIKYPWEKYGQIPVEDFLYGAMENTSATIFGDFLSTDNRGFANRNYVGVNAHEMAHQWFGDLVTAKNHAHAWLQESFATHYGKLAMGHIYGQDESDWTQYNDGNSALNASKDNSLPINHSGSGTARIYPKGSFVLSMLKDIVGRDDYNRVIASYLKKNGYGNVSTFDLQDEFHDVLGIELDWFFDQWVRRGGEPQFTVAYSTQSGPSKATVVSVRQTHAIGDQVRYFRAPIWVEVTYVDGARDSAKAWVDGASSSIIVPNAQGKEVSFVIFDPANGVLKSLVFERSNKALIEQAGNAHKMIDRYMALVALRNAPSTEKRALLLDMQELEEHYGILGEVANQLASDDTKEAQESLILLIGHRDPRIRVSAIDGVKKLTPELGKALDNRLADTAYAVAESAFRKLLKLDPTLDATFMNKTSTLVGPSKSTRIFWLQTALADKDLPQSKRDLYSAELIDYAGNSFEFRTRINAMEAMRNLNLWNTTAMRSVIEAYLGTNGRLASPAEQTLNHFYSALSNKATLETYVSDGKWTSTQKEKLGKVISR